MAPQSARHGFLRIGRFLFVEPFFVTFLLAVFFLLVLVLFFFVPFFRSTQIRLSQHDTPRVSPLPLDIHEPLGRRGWKGAHASLAEREPHDAAFTDVLAEQTRVTGESSWQARYHRHA
jgi:hypothetical protein